MLGRCVFIRVVNARITSGEYLRNLMPDFKSEISYGSCSLALYLKCMWRYIIMHGSGLKLFATEGYIF